MKNQILKRTFDIFFSLSILFLGLPLFIVIILAIKLTSKGPALYCGTRIGKNGLPFKFWKFRSMHENADERLKELLATDPTLLQEWQTYFKLKNDPRLTPIGNFLRKTSIDELPQFWNVLIGDLSVVGPRPYPPGELKELNRVLKDLNTDEKKCEIFSIRPGLTGIWQTSGRNNLTFEQKVQMHLTYIQTQSFWLDLYLIAKTIPMFIFPKGAF